MTKFKYPANQAESMIAKEVMGDFVKVDRQELVTNLIGKFGKTKQAVVFVFEDDIFLGVVALKDLLKTKIPRGEKLNKVIRHVPSVPEDEDLLDIATLMFHSDSNALPVVRDEKVVGAVFATDVIKHIKSIPELEKLKVSDLRNTAVRFVKENDRIGKAIEIMVEEDINRLPILDENKSATGIISFGDIMEKLLRWSVQREGGFKSGLQYPGTKGFRAEKTDMLAMPVKSFQSGKAIITAAPNDKITKIVDLMVENDISGVVIIDKNVADSIVTKRDLLEAMMNTKKIVTKNIQFVGLNDLREVHPHLIDYVKKISSYYGEKIGYLVKNINTIKVHIKGHKKSGRAHKFSVHIKVSSPGMAVTSNKAVDWDVSRAMHKAFKDVERQILHKSKGDTGYKKRYY